MATVESHSKQSSLILGWKVTLSNDPKYWLVSTAKAGSQSDSDLVKIPAAAIANHTAIIAQSGSGKSFFLGRLIEEIILRTRARCVIFDPNADYRRIYEVEDESLWKSAGFNQIERRGKLPHESSRDEFASRWERIPTVIRMGGGANGDNCEPIKLWWPSLSMDFFSEDVDPMLRSDLYHCHAFVKSLGALVDFKYIARREAINLINEAQRIFELARVLSKDNLRASLESDFNVNQLITAATAEDTPSSEGLEVLVAGQSEVIKREFIERAVNRFIERALTISEYVSPDIERFYFGKAREYQTSGILQTKLQERPWARYYTKRLEVIDLPSLPDRGTRLLTINALLTKEWTIARNAWNRALSRPSHEDRRVPTFIVVDEAHNLIPNEPRGKADIALREQFRTIVAEGRKYGLFIVPER